MSKPFAPYVPFPIKAPAAGFHVCDVAYCREIAVHDFGKYERRTGFTGEIRSLCATHLKGTNIGKVRTFPKGCCQKCGTEKVEGRYCPICDVK
jgi:hypothetical protein